VQRYGAAFDRDLEAVVGWPWKLIVSDSGTFEVHRLDRDPGEAEDLRDGAEARELWQVLAAERATLRPSQRSARPAELTPDILEQLRALGYLPR
jgi:hypothetical protein